VFLCGVALLSAEEAGQRWWSHVRFLADDKLEGRKPGTPGYEEAARYVAGQFDRLKLKPAGTRGYFQPVPIQARQINEAQSKIEFIRDGRTDTFDFSRDGFLAARGESGRVVEADAVFIGYGLRIPEANIDDLKGSDLKGKIAVYLTGAPRSVPGPLAAHSQSAAERWKNLQAAGAIGVATLFNTNRVDIPWDRVVLSRTRAGLSLRDQDLVDTPGVQVAMTVGASGADKLLAETGYTLPDLLRLDKENKDLPKFPAEGPAARPVIVRRRRHHHRECRGAAPRG
jgi:hypothetical protein